MQAFNGGAAARVALAALAILTAAAPTLAEPPEKALRYHGVLLRRPAPGYVFDRFVNAWLDESTIAELEQFLNQRAQDPGAAGDGLLLAFFYSKQGDDVAAIEQFRKALAAEPGNASAWHQKAVLEARTLDYETALADLEKAAAAGPDAELAIRIAKLRGQTLVRRRDREGALEVFQKLIAENPDDEELAEDVIELQVNEGLFDEAAATAEKLIDATRDPYRKVLRRLRLGDIRMQAGERDDALGLYRETLADVGAESWLEREILAQIERAFRREDDITGLSGEYERLLEEFPRRIGVRRGYARVLADSGDTDAAIEQFREILKITPGDRANQEAFVQLFLRSGDAASARKQLEAIIAQNPDDGELYTQLAELAKKTDDAPAAAKAVDDYLKLSAKDEYAYLRAARLLERLELTDGARAKYQALTEAFPASLAAKEARAAFLYKTDDKAEAIELWTAAAQGDDPQQAVRVARALAGRQEHEAAYELLESRLEAFDDDPLLLGQLIDEAIALKKFEEAAPLARRRVDLADEPGLLDEAVSQAAKVFDRGELVSQELGRLIESATTPQRVCLLAELYEKTGDIQQADAALAPLVEKGDPLATAQKVRMARSRRDWPAAIDATLKLVNLPGGRRSRNVRRLVECYERSFQTDKALEWVREWKKLSPGSTTPWLTESRLLMIAGKENESLDVLRTAMREFDGAAEVRSRLAMLYQSTGKLADAERIYWRDYEDGADLLAKLRAVEQLARIAEQAGKTEALLANFEERKRANRTSLEPLMAMATIYRVTNQYDKRLQTLAEASKLRPDDLNLLRQVARVEEQEGEWERARDTLRQAMKLDKSGRTRQQLAALLLRWGNPEEGYALLYQSLDESEADPREVERLADAMISAGDWDRVTEFLEPRVGQWPEDFRLRFLLATAQEETDALAAAAENFLAVLDIEEQASPASAPPTPNQVNTYYEELYRIAPSGVRDLVESTRLNQMVYNYRRQQNRSSGLGSLLSVGGGVGLIVPPKIEDAHRYALAHLAMISRNLPDDRSEALRDAISRREVAGTDIEVVLAFSSPTNQRRPSPAELLEKFPQRDSVAAYVLLNPNNANKQIEAKFYRESFERFSEDYPELALLAGLQGLTFHEELSDLVGPLKSHLEEIERPSSITVMMLCTMPQRLGGRQMPQANDAVKEFGDLLRERVVDWYPLVRNRQPYGQWMFNYMAGLLRAGDDPRAYLKLLEDEVIRYRKDPAVTRSAAYQTAVSRQNNQNLIVPPEFPPASLQKFPAQVLQLVSPNRAGRQVVVFTGQQNAAIGWDDDQLAEALPSVDDPTLRLLLAHKLDDRDKVEEAIKELLGSESPGLDDYLIAAGWATEREQFDQAIRHLEKARYLPMDRSARRMVDGQLVALVLERLNDYPKDGELLKTAREAALRLRHGVMQPNERQALASALGEFGLQEEADKLLNYGSRRASPSRVVRVVRTNQSRVSADRIQKLIEAGKKDAAARLLSREVLAEVRQFQRSPGNMSYLRHQQQQLRRRIQKYALDDEVLKALDPGETANHRRLVEFAEVLEAFDKPDRAVDAYARALEVRPKEDAYRVKLIVAHVLADEMDEAIAHLDQLGRTGPEQLVQAMLGMFQDHQSGFDARLIWGRLGVSMFKKEAAKTNADLSWASALRRALANPQHTRSGSMPALYMKNTSDGNPSTAKASAKRRDIHDELCRLMLEDDRLAADGFTGLLASHEAHAEDPEEGAEEGAAAGDGQDDSFAEMAKSALLRSKRDDSMGHSVYQQHYYVSYSSSQLATAVVERTPGEHLVRHCWNTGDWSVLDDEVLPHLRENSQAPAAQAIERYRKLYETEPEEFSEAAKEFVRKGSEDNSRRPSMPDTAPVKVYEAYQERDLDIDLQQLVLSFVKESLRAQTRSGPLPFVISYTQSLAKDEGADAATEWLEKVAEVYAGPRDRREKFIERNYDRRSISWGTPNAGLHSLGNTLQQLLNSGGPALAPTVRLLSEGGVSGLVQNIDSYLQRGLRNALNQGDNAAAAVEFLEDTGLLGDTGEMGVAWARVGGDGGRTFGQIVADQLKSRRNTTGYKNLAKLLAEREQQTLGVRMWRCALTFDNETQQRRELLGYLEGRLEKLDELPKNQREGAAQTLAHLARVEANTARLDRVSEWLKSLQSAGAERKTETILKANRFEDLKVEAHEVDEWLGGLISSLAAEDPSAAAKVYFKVTSLYDEAMSRNAVNMYFSRSATTELLRRMTYRMDRQSPTMTRLAIALMQSPEGAEKFTLPDYEARTFVDPVRRQFQTFANQSRQAKGGARGAVEPFHTWLKNTFPGGSSPILMGAYRDGLTGFNENDLGEAESWLKEKLEADAEDAFAADLLAFVQRQRAEHGRRRNAKDKPESPHLAHFQQVLKNKDYTLAERLCFAGQVQQWEGARAPESITRALVTLSNEALGTSVLLDSQLERVVALSAVRLDESAPGDPVTVEFREKWLDRFVNRQAQRSGNYPRYSANDATNQAAILRVLGLCYRQADSAGAKKLLARYESRIGTRAETIGLLVREGEVEPAARLVRSGWNNFPLSTLSPPPVQYDAALHANLPKLKQELGDGPMAYLAEAALATLPDAPAEERGDAPDKPARLRDIAGRFEQSGVSNKEMRIKTLLMFRSEDAALVLVAEPLAELADPIDVRRITQAPNFEDQVQLVVMHARRRAAEGNFEPLISLLIKFTVQEGDDYWRLQNQYHRHSQVLSEVWEKSIDKLTPEGCRAAADDLRELFVASSRMSSGREYELSCMSAYAHARAGLGKEFKEWIEGLEENDRQRLERRGVDQKLWKWVVRGLDKEDAGTFDERVERLAELLKLVDAGGWIEMRNPTDDRLRSRGGTTALRPFEEVFTKAELPEAAAAVAEWAPGSGGAVWVAAARALERAKQHAAASQAWAEAAKLAEEESHAEGRYAKQVEQIEQAHRAGDGEAALKLLAEARESGAPPAAQKRYDALAEKLAEPKNKPEPEPDSVGEGEPAAEDEDGHEQEEIAEVEQKAEPQPAAAVAK